MRRLLAKPTEEVCLFDTLGAAHQALLQVTHDRCLAFLLLTAELGTHLWVCEHGSLGCSLLSSEDLVWCGVTTAPARLLHLSLLALILDL